MLKETEQKLARLEKRLRETQMDRDILKKLSVFSLGTTANIQVRNESQYVISCWEDVFSIEGELG